MSEETATETPVEKPKTSIRRKALIVIGATAGLIIAGGLVLFKKEEDCDCGCKFEGSETDGLRALDEYGPDSL